MNKMNAPTVEFHSTGVSGKIKLYNVTVMLNGKRVLQNVNFEFSGDKVYGLIGPSGGGKSVLLKTIFGVFDPESGYIHTENVHSTALQFQEGGLFDSMTVADNIAVQLTGYKKTLSELKYDEKQRVFDAVFEAARVLNLTGALFKMPHELSGGMKKRVLLARAVVSNASAIGLDDPTAGLDPINAKAAVTMVKQVRAILKPLTIIAFHKIEYFLEIVDEYLFIEGGRITVVGSFDEIRRIERVQKFFSSVTL